MSRYESNRRLAIVPRGDDVLSMKGLRLKTFFQINSTLVNFDKVTPCSEKQNMTKTIVFHQILLQWVNFELLLFTMIYDGHYCRYYY